MANILVKRIKVEMKKKKCYWNRCPGLFKKTKTTDWAAPEQSTIPLIYYLGIRCFPGHTISYYRYESGHSWISSSKNQNRLSKNVAGHEGFLIEYDHNYTGFSLSDQYRVSQGKHLHFNLLWQIEIFKLDLVWGWFGNPV